MDSIDLMMREHENILTLVSVIRIACCKVLEGEPVDDTDFRDIITFARIYADRHHHGKEEQILFREMSARLGPVANNLIQHGMLVEHDLGRLHMAELEAALNRYAAAPSTMDKLEILSHATGWADLLERHIEKENNAVYSFARRTLGPEVLAIVDAESNRLEETAEAAGVQYAALGLLKRLHRKYGKVKEET